MKKLLVTSLGLLAAIAQLNAASISTSAAQSSGFSLVDGTDLPLGSVVRLGVFNLTDVQIVANASDYAFLNANFVTLDTAFIGKGDPAGSGDIANAGLFVSTLSGINTVANSTAGKLLSYWVFDSATPASATSQGIFSSTTWTVPSGDGTPTDLSSLSTDISDLTVGNLGVTLLGSAKVIIGSFGPGTNATGGGKDFVLAATSAIPEPSTYAAFAGIAVLGLAALRRRRA